MDCIYLVGESHVKRNSLQLNAHQSGKDLSILQEMVAEKSVYNKKWCQLA